jgi:hypothetical protein
LISVEEGSKVKDTHGKDCGEGEGRREADDEKSGENGRQSADQQGKFDSVEEDDDDAGRKGG